MNKKETQIEFESVTFMHEKREDYMDKYTEPPCKCKYVDRFCNTCEVK